MGSEVDQPEPISTPKLSLLIIPPDSLPEDQSVHFYTSASIPFLWEEEPGKPRPCTDQLIDTVPVSDHPNNGGPKCLVDLPPRLQSSELKTTKVPSPTTVLDGPYVGLMPINIVQGVPFGFKRERRREGSTGSNYGGGSPERGLLGDMVLIGKKGEESSGGLFGSFGRRWSSTVGRNEELGGMVRSSSMKSLADSGGDEGGRRSRWEPLRKIRRIGSLRKIRRTGSFSSLSEASRSNFWATMYEGFKQVLPWKSKQAKNEGLTT
ncbi:uncharacterized protein At4g00950-like [Rhododendron vialii]|uniref:uncharacterized protein At4g00950-like n=1 Tax=Rhododendron vialii TaxID=182163 RepID=UPI00265F17D8|nr:uncharacterized protein At4g00950-like [Rhododendron vialii]